MTLRSRLGALALGVAMVCGAASAEAAVYHVFSGEFSTTGFDSRNFDVTIPLQGMPTNPNAQIEVQAQVSASGSGFLAGWGGFVSGTANGTPFLAESAGCDLPFETNCTRNNHMSGSVPVLEAFWHLTITGFVSGFYSGLGPGSTSVNYSITVDLPDGVSPVPLPGALPLMASVLGIGGWLGYRRKQRAAAAAAA